MRSHRDEIVTDGILANLWGIRLTLGYPTPPLSQLSRVLMLLEDEKFPKEHLIEGFITLNKFT